MVVENMIFRVPLTVPLPVKNQRKILAPEINLVEEVGEVVEGEEDEVEVVVVIVEAEEVVVAEATPIKGLFRLTMHSLILDTLYRDMTIFPVTPWIFQGLFTHCMPVIGIVKVSAQDLNHYVGEKELFHGILPPALYHVLLASN